MSKYPGSPRPQLLNSAFVHNLTLSCLQAFTISQKCAIEAWHTVAGLPGTQASDRNHQTSYDDAEKNLKG
jgi:hypothetical protein